METLTVNRELYLAAALVARPEYVPAVFPPDVREGRDLRILENRTAKAVVTILATQGRAFANPAALTAALADLPVEIDGEEVVALMSLIPDPEDVQLEELIDLRDKLAKAVNQRALAKQLTLAAVKLRQGDEEGEVEARSALNDHQRNKLGRDPTTRGITERMDEGKFNIRYRIGCQQLDELVRGIGPDGEFSSGVAGTSEIIVISGMPGTGKTRLVLNWADALLDQNANLCLVVGEDTEAAYSAGFIGIHCNIPSWHVEYFTAAPAKFADVYGSDAAKAARDGIEWYKSLYPRLRIYDREAKVRISKFPQALALLEEDKLLYGTTHVIIDYINIWKGETKDLEGYAQDLQDFAGRTRTGVFELSQIPNDAIKNKPTPGQVVTKGSGDWGQTAHTGYFLEQDFIVGQKEMRITQTKGRKAGGAVVYAHFNVETGRISRYVETPVYMQLPELPKEARPKGRR